MASRASAIDVNSCFSILRWAADSKYDFTALAMSLPYWPIAIAFAVVSIGFMPVWFTLSSAILASLSEMLLLGCTARRISEPIDQKKQKKQKNKKNKTKKQKNKKCINERGRRRGQKSLRYPQDSYRLQAEELTCWRPL
jgi:hypothetical protein